MPMKPNVAVLKTVHGKNITYLDYSYTFFTKFKIVNLNTPYHKNSHELLMTALTMTSTYQRNNSIPAGYKKNFTFFKKMIVLS